MGKATGFFHTREADGRWWMVDPAGGAFYMIGTDHANYRAHGCEALGYAPHARFVAEKYGSEQAWGEVVIGRLKEWGFNSLTAGHSESLRQRDLPHTEFLAMGASFSD